MQQVLVVVVAVALGCGGLKAADTSTGQWATLGDSMTPSPQDLCDGARTADACQASAHGPYCVWAEDKCAFRATSCPTALGQRVTALAHCGATADDRCPPSCLGPERDLMATACLRAGITQFNGTEGWATQARTDPKLAQVMAEMIVCLSQLKEPLASACLGKLTPPDVNSAITAQQSGAAASSAAVSPSASELMTTIVTIAAVAISFLAVARF